MNCEAIKIIALDQLNYNALCSFVVFNRQPSAGKVDGTTGNTVGGAAGGSKRAGQTSANVGGAASKGKSQNTTSGSNKVSSTGSGRPGTGKANSEKNIDTTKAHWTLRIVSDAEKAVRKKNLPEKDKFESVAFRTGRNQCEKGHRKERRIDKYEESMGNA